MANPVDVQISGEALVSKGFEAFKTIDGVGLNTFGFLWSLAGIWSPGETVPTTVWSDCTDDVGVGLGT